MLIPGPFLPPRLYEQGLRWFRIFSQDLDGPSRTLLGPTPSHSLWHPQCIYAKSIRAAPAAQQSIIEWEIPQGMDGSPVDRTVRRGLVPVSRSSSVRPGLGNMAAVFGSS